MSSSFERTGDIIEVQGIEAFKRVSKVSRVELGGIIICIQKHNTEGENFLNAENLGKEAWATGIPDHMRNLSTFSKICCGFGAVKIALLLPAGRKGLEVRILLSNCESFLIPQFVALAEGAGIHKVRLVVEENCIIGEGSGQRSWAQVVQEEPASYRYVGLESNHVTRPPDPATRRANSIQGENHEEPVRVTAGTSSLKLIVDANVVHTQEGGTTVPETVWETDTDSTDSEDIIGDLALNEEVELGLEDGEICEVLESDPLGTMRQPVIRKRGTIGQPGCACEGLCDVLSVAHKIGISSVPDLMCNNIQGIVNVPSGGDGRSRIRSSNIQDAVTDYNIRDTTSGTEGTIALDAD